MSNKSILFLTLKIFSATGGIEKVCRIIGKVLWDNSVENGTKINICSMHDDSILSNTHYFPVHIYEGFAGHKLHFGIRAATLGIKNDVVVLSHINLLLFGFLIKRLKPTTKIVLLAHGIEVWKEITGYKLKWLQQCDLIISVSNYTKQKMIQMHGIAEHKCVVINNCIDPFLPVSYSNKKSLELLEKYGIEKNRKVLLTLSRLSSHDRDKGYDKVLHAIHELKEEYPQLVYLIAGKYEQSEKIWLDNLIQKYKLENKVFFSGYIPDNQLPEHFGLADIYIMPSKKEGFGIIFIEALFYGKPVIGGNRDGSVDALANGQFGLLVDPDNQCEITNAIRSVLLNTNQYTPDKNKVVEYFGYESYKLKFLKALDIN